MKSHLPKSAQIEHKVGSKQNNLYSTLNEEEKVPGYFLDSEGGYLGNIGGNEVTDIYKTDEPTFNRLKEKKSGFKRKIGTLDDYKYLLAAVHGETLKGEGDETLKEREGIAHCILNWKKDKNSGSIKSAAKQIANVFRDGNGRTSLIMDKWVVAWFKYEQTEDIEISKRAVFNVLNYHSSGGKVGSKDPTQGANSWDGLNDFKVQYNAYKADKIPDGKWNKFEKGYKLSEKQKKDISGVKSVKSDNGYLYEGTNKVGNSVFAKYTGE